LLVPQESPDELADALLDCTKIKTFEGGGARAPKSEPGDSFRRRPSRPTSEKS
jgi:hypothetical protein